MENEICTRLTTLGHPQRLALFRLLMRRYPDRVPAGELAQALDIKPSTLSAYLSALMQAGLVTQDRIATSLQYRVAMGAVSQTVDYLFNDCCRGRPELCTPALFAKNPVTSPKYNVLFICTGNSARSILAESILRNHAGDRFNAYSAGTLPRSALHPVARDMLRAKGHDIAALSAKNVTVFTGPDAPAFDFVFTVCNQAANEDGPTWQGQPVSAHWGMPDPVKATGTDAAQSLSFQRTYDGLAHRISLFAALPIASLDRVALQKAVDQIA
jgi:arsenate reductase